VTAGNHNAGIALMEVK